MKQPIRALMFAATLGLCAPTLALAAPGQPESAAKPASDKPLPPQQLARQTVANILAAMKGRRDELRTHPKKLYQLVNQELVPLIDLHYMSRLVLGRYWRTASPEQKKRFETAFKNMLIATYGHALLDFKDDDAIKYLPVRAPDGAKDVTFRAVIQSDNGQNIPIGMQLHLVDGHWKVYNGTVGNLSFVTNYRGQFNAQIRHGGLDKLIERMEARYNPDSAG